MGRPLRTEVPSGVYHVGSKGNRGITIYADDHERQVFLQLLGRLAARHDWTLFAYCLMSTHYHLVLRIGDAGMSAGMQQLNGGFSRYSNARHGIEGHLFRNRFWSKLVEDDAQLLQTVRYVVLNPIRAGLCRSPEAWPWSSHRASAGLDFAPAFLASGDLLQRFGRSPQTARTAYRAFVGDGMSEA